MTTYKGIKGLGLQGITSDAVADQMSGGAWASGTNINTARRNQGSAGIESATIIYGGASSPQLQQDLEHLQQQLL